MTTFISYSSDVNDPRYLFKYNFVARQSLSVVEQKSQ